jgi:diguanylate cyclase (GGDEF)-like protein
VSEDGAVLHHVLTARTLAEKIARGGDLLGTYAAIAAHIHGLLDDGHERLVVIRSYSAADDELALAALAPDVPDTRALLEVQAADSATARAAARSRGTIVDSSPGQSTEQGFAAGWASPALDASGALVATVGIYSMVGREVSANDLAMLDLAVMLVVVAAGREASALAQHKSMATDYLTGLPNHVGFLEAVSSATAAGRTAGGTAVLYLWIDGIRHVDDTYGRPVGDEAVQALARVLVDSLGPRAVVARTDRDVFCVLLRDTVPSKVDIAAQTIARAVEEPIIIGGIHVVFSLTMGIAIAAAGESALDVFSHAEIARAEAKTRGRGSIVVYDEQFAAIVRHRGEVAVGLRRALNRGELTVHYQPIVDITTGRTIGAEALSRWDMERPDVFIPIAESAGLIQELGLRVLRQTLEESIDWVRADPEFVVHINVSPEQLIRPDLVGTFLSQVTRSDFPLRQIALELTEEADLTDPAAWRALEEFADVGFQLAVDDFGTGYSSPDRLARSRFSVLKIDQGFVSRLDRSLADVRIARLLAAFGHELGMEVIAEGVETEEQRTILMGMGCTQAQGFLFSRAVPAEEFAAVMAATPRPVVSDWRYSQ